MSADTVFNTTHRIRISRLAKLNHVTSKSMIHTFNLVAPDLGIKSASSTVEVGPHNKQFIESVWAHCELIGG